VCEDAGLAAAAGEGSLRLPHLQLYSAVCGCGLDTVPVPGPTVAGGGGAGGDAPGREAGLRLAVAGVIADVAALAHRLGKPLAVRLLPIPGGEPGDDASFPGNPYLLPSRVMAFH